MKGLLIILAVVVALFVLINNDLIPVSAPAVGGPVVSTFKYAALAAAEPDETIKVPVKGVRPKQIANTWNSPRGADRLHQGQDIFAPRGTPVTSATDGYVVRIGESDLGGKTVSVLGAGRRVYYYAHLDAYADGLEVGDEVTPETVLGYVGTTGNAKGTPPHLHFGIYTMDGAIDPLPLFRDKPEPAKAG